MQLPFFINTCLICGRVLAPGECHVCTLCAAQVEPPVLLPADMIRRFAGRPLVEAHYSLFTYRHEDAMANMLRQGKYNNRPEYMRTLARMLVSELQAAGVLSGVDVIVPVPMHWFKQLCRGYNQTHIVGKEISRATGIPMLKALKAVRAHRKLAGSTPEQRAKAVSGLFRAVKPQSLNGMRVALVDDVLTTGSTLTAAAQAVKSAGAASIITLTLGTTPPAPSVD